MFQKVTQGIIAGSLLWLALIATYFAIDYVRVKMAVKEHVTEAAEERALEADRAAIEESRARREAERDRAR